VAGVFALLMRRRRLVRAAIVLKPATLLRRPLVPSAGHLQCVDGYCLTPFGQRWLDDATYEAVAAVVAARFVEFWNRSPFVSGEVPVSRC